MQTLFRLSRLAGAVACGISIHPLPAAAPTTAAPDAIYAAAFGAVPNDGQDDTDGLRKAVAALKASGAHRLVLAPGQYDFGSGLVPARSALLTFAGLDGITIEGNGAVFMFHDRVTPLSFEHCAHVAVKNLTIDWARPFFSQGRVLRASRLTFDVQVDPQYPVTGREEYQAMIDYDPVTRLPLGNLVVLSSAAITEHKLIGPQQLRVTLRTPEQPEQRAHFLWAVSQLPGRLVVLQHVIYGNYGIDCVDCAEVLVEDVNIYTSAGMGVHMQTTHDVTFRRLAIRIKPDSGRLMSTTADAQFFSHCTGSILIDHGFIEGSGDDGLNVSGKYRTVVQVTDPQTIAATVPDGSWVGPLPRPGEKMEICDPQTLGIRDVATVKAANWSPELKAFEIRFASPLGVIAREGDLLASERYLPAAHIVDTTFKGLRARGMVLSTHDILVERCRFEALPFAAIQLLAGPRSHFQGPAVINAIFRHNIFTGCAGAAIYSDSSVPDPNWDVFRDLTIEDNTITEDPALFAQRFRKDHPLWPYWRSAICLSSASHVVIRGNRIEGYQSAIYLDRVADVRVSDNRVTPAGTLVVNPDRTRAVEVHDNDGLSLQADHQHVFDPAPYFINVFR